MIRTRSLCKPVFLLIITQNRSSCTHHTAGATVQGPSLSLLTSSRLPSTPRSGLLSLYGFPIPNFISTSLKTLFTVIAIRLHGPYPQDRQSETPSHLRPLGPVHRMHFGFGHFGMSPCCSVCDSRRCYQHYSLSDLSQRNGIDMGYQHRRGPCQEVLDAVH